MKYLFFDIDGTILSHEEGISLSTVEAFKLAKSNGHKIFICTGRSYAEIPKTFYEFNFDGVIAAAGAYIKVGEEVIFNKIMPEKLVDNIIKELLKTDMPYVLEGIEAVYSHKDATYYLESKYEEMLAKKNETNYQYSAYFYKIDELKSIADYYNEKKDISKMVIYGDSPDSYNEIEKIIDEDFYLIKYPKNAELVASGVNKFTGIQKIIEYLNADINDTVAFGDSLNDYEMIKNSNIGIAVGNASDEVKEVADYVTDDIHEDGIYNALKYYNII